MPKRFSLLIFFLMVPMARGWCAPWALGYPDSGEVVIYRSFSREELVHFSLRIHPLNSTCLYQWSAGNQRKSHLFDVFRSREGSIELFSFLPREAGEGLFEGLRKEGGEPVIAGRESPGKGLATWGIVKKPYLYVFLASTLFSQFAYDQAVDAHQTATTQKDMDFTYHRAKVIFGARNLMAGATLASFMMRF